MAFEARAGSPTAWSVLLTAVDNVRVRRRIRSPRLIFTVSEGATEKDVDSVCRAALPELWGDLAWLDVDLEGLEGDPDCAEAVSVLQPLRRRHWLSKQLQSVVHLVPGRDDDKVTVVAPLLSRTIYSAGLSRHDGHMVFNAHDRGTSCLFELTSEQLARLQAALVADGAPVDVLVPWRNR